MHYITNEDVLEKYMLVISGIFENERFIPDRPVLIPQKKKVVVTIEEEKPGVVNPAMTWRDIGNAILACDEELPGFPVPIKFKTIEEMEAL